MNGDDPIKLHKRVCYSQVIMPFHPDENVKMTDGVATITCGYDFLRVPTHELVGLWYRIGELLNVDRETAKELLQGIHWRHEW